jgi:CheY-like chemotaxis protein
LRAAVEGDSWGGVSQAVPPPADARDQHYIGEIVSNCTIPYRQQRRVFERWKKQAFAGLPALTPVHCRDTMQASPAAANGSLVRVLIVDDNPDAAKVLSILLRHCGFEVDVVIDSTLCLSHLESFSPDVLLLDIGMPKLSGYDLARQIRTRPEFGQLVIFAISGYADSKHAQWSLEAGCDRHLVKPVSPQALMAGITDEVEKRLKSQPGACIRRSV